MYIKQIAKGFASWPGVLLAHNPLPEYQGVYHAETAHG